MHWSSKANSTISETLNSVPISERYLTKPNINSNKKKKYMLNNEMLNNINHINHTSRIRSPNELTDNINTLEKLETINYYLNTY